MVAASFWSLLAPAIELAENSGTYGAHGEYAFLPVAGGFLLGAIFVFGADKILSYLGIISPNMMVQLTHTNKDIDAGASQKHDKNGLTGTLRNVNEGQTSIGIESFSDCLGMQNGTASRKCKKSEQTAKNAEVRYFYLLHFHIVNIKSLVF